MRNALGIILALACSPAWSCGTGKILLEEKFAQRPSFIAEDAAIKYSNGTMEEVRAPNTAWWTWPLIANRDYEVCVKVSATSESYEKGSPSAGVAFFAAHNEQFNTIFVSNAAGTFQVAQRVGNSWQTVIAWSQHKAINRGPTAENEISVSTRGNFAAIRINGVLVAELNSAITGEDGKTFAGFARQSAPDKPATFRIREYQIREAVWDKK